MKIDKLPLEAADTLSDLQRPPMLIADLIPEGSITLVAAPTYTGKTFLSMEVARSVAFGGKFLGHFQVERQGNVLFIEQDSPKYDTGRAFYAMIRNDIAHLREHNTMGGRPLDALQFAWHPGLDLKDPMSVARIIRTANSLFTSHGHDEHGEEVGDKGAVLIVLDTFRALHTAEENSSTEMEAIMQNVKLIRKSTGAAILLIHHGPKPTKGMPDYMGVRGSTAIEGAVDTILKLSRQKEGVRVTVAKARAIQPPNFVFDISTEGDTKRVYFVHAVDGAAAAAEQGTDNRAALLSLLRNHKGLTRAEVLMWATMNGYSEGSLARWLSSLYEENLIHKEVYTDNGNRRVRYFALDNPPVS